MDKKNIKKYINQAIGVYLSLIISNIILLIVINFIYGDTNIKILKFTLMLLFSSIIGTGKILFVADLGLVKYFGEYVFNHKYMFSSILINSFLITFSERVYLVIAPNFRNDVVGAIIIGSIQLLQFCIIFSLIIWISKQIKIKLK